MDAKHIQSYFYVGMLLDKLIKFRGRSLELLGVLNHNTEVFLVSLTNIASNQHNADQLQPRSIAHVEEIWDQLPEGIMDEGSMDEYLLLQKILELKEQCSVANIVAQI